MNETLPVEVLKTVVSLSMTWTRTGLEKRIEDRETHRILFLVTCMFHSNAASSGNDQDVDNNSAVVMVYVSRFFCLLCRLVDDPFSLKTVYRKGKQDKGSEASLTRTSGLWRSMSVAPMIMTDKVK